MLKLQFSDKRSAPFWIVEKRYTIGRAANNHLVIDDPSLSELHARLITEQDELILKDNNSPSGCFVNNQRVTEKLLLPGDVIRIGNVELEVLAPQEGDPDSTGVEPNRWSLVADSSWLAGKEYPIPQGSAVIGRGNQCDIMIAGTHLSRQHAQLTLQDNQLHIKDLGSANGTYLNDKRIDEGVVRAGDRLRLDVYSFRVIGPEEDPHKTRIRRAPAPSPSNTANTEPKIASSEPKQWKTKSTSPGNRIEPEKPKKPNFLGVLSTVLLVALAVILVSIFKN